MEGAEDFLVYIFMFYAFLVICCIFLAYLWTYKKAQAPMKDSETSSISTM